MFRDNELMVKEKTFTKRIIKRVINAKSDNDLKKLYDEVIEYKFRDYTRSSFLLGLIFGSLMQFNKETAIDYLDTIRRSNG